MLGPAYQRGYGVWIRDGVIVYTMWKDTKVVRVASTVHSGNSHNQVKRRFKTSTGVVEVMVSIASRPCSTLLILDATYDYNMKMGGVDLQISCFSISRQGARPTTQVLQDTLLPLH